MNRATRDKFVSGTQKDLTSGNACWQTAPLIYESLNIDYGPFTVDLTGDARRSLSPLWFGPDSPFGPPGFDALTADWTLTTNGYSNPPYGPFVQKMLAKAKAEAAKGFTSTLLLPLRVTQAFKEHVLFGAAELLFCDKRLVFFEDDVPRINEELWVKKGKARADAAMFDSIIVRYLPGHPPGARPKVGTWEVPPHVTKEDLARAKERREKCCGVSVAA